MPILTGIQACKQIHQFYKNNKRNRLPKENDGNINELERLLTKYETIYGNKEF